MEYDSKTKQLIANPVLAQSITADGTTVGSIIDTKGFESITLALMIHSIGGVGDHTLSLEDGDDPALADTAPVLVADDPQTVIGTFKTLDTALQINRVGYIGKKRYLRATINTANAAALTGVAGVIAVLANAQSGPTTDQ